MNPPHQATLAGFSATPLPLAEKLQRKLRNPGSDGNWYLDFKAKGKWDGNIVVNPDGVVIGIYVGRQIRQWTLPFWPQEIEDVRPASIMNRLLAAVPDELWFWLPPMSLAAAAVLMAVRQYFSATAVVVLGMAPVVMAPRAYCITGCPMLVAAAGIAVINLILAAKYWLD